MQSELPKKRTSLLKAKSSKLKAIVVIYHKGCNDGFGAAWSAWKKFGNKAEYLGEEHGRPVPKNLKNKDVYIIDFGYSLEDTKKILKDALSLTVIDHHISARQVIQTVPNHIYDNNRSGATLAWRYFHPRKPIPKLLEYIEDSDLWKFKLRNTKEIISSANLYPFDFKVWDKIGKEMENKIKIKKYIQNGKVIRRYEEKIIEKAIYRSNLVRFEGYDAIAANSSVLTSEIGNALVKIKPPISIIFSQIHGRKIVSLRSNGKVDVSKIAAKYGGGGHYAAAGFHLELNEPYPWKVIKPMN